MLAISAPVFDVIGRLIIENPAPDGLAGFSRRVSRTPTLDGEAAITDFGYNVADRTLTIRWRPRSEDETALVRYLVQSYGRLIVSFREGCFLGAPESYDELGGEITVIYLVERQLNA